MATPVKTSDRSVSIHPYYIVPDTNMGAFRKLCERFVERTSSEAKCLHYGFSFGGNEVFCREAYEDAAGALAHLENVGDLLEEALTLAEVARLEVHGMEEELAHLRGPLEEMDVIFYALDYGFRK